MKKFTIILNLIFSKGKLLAFFLAALCCVSASEIAAQNPTCPPGIPCNIPTPVQTPVPKSKPDKTDKKTAPTVVTPNPRPLPTPPPSSKRVVVNESETPAEKSIVTESKVSINLCVQQGNVRINGWDRDEIRAYVAEGSQVGFKIVQTSAKTKKPVWINVLGFDPQTNKEVKPEECLSGTDIELDVPRNATIKLKSGESDIKIESVAKVWVANLGGSIFLNDISNGIEATTYRGDLTVERSSGQIVLNNGDGNIIVIDVEPSEIGDFFKAKTASGRITLQGVGHRLIETNSISGSTSFIGELLSGGQYGFSTENGSIVMTVPQDSSCKINASFGFGAFSSELPLVNNVKKEQNLSAQLGSAEATCGMNLRTNSGVIRIRKQQ